MKEEVTNGDFAMYRMVQRAGYTNMNHIRNVMELTGLSREKILYIRENYEELQKRDEEKK